MWTYLGWLLAAIFSPLVVYAQEAMVKKAYNDLLPTLHNGIIASFLQEYENPFTLYPYDTNYLLYTWTNNLNKEVISPYSWSSNALKDEVKFQLSLAFPFWRGIAGTHSVLGASYTQKSWWQLSNSGESSPFRETNYEPQLFLGFSTNYQFAGWALRDIEVGYNHNSNGRSEPTSRSWNRFYTRFIARNDNWIVELKPWYILGYSKNKPDITKYIGYYQLRIGYRTGEVMISIKGQYNWNTGYGNAELGLSYPIMKHARFYTQVYSGYGESLIDYNFNQTRIGVGVMLNDLF